MRSYRVLLLLPVISSALSFGALIPDGGATAPRDTTRRSEAPADTQVFNLPFEVIITAPRMSIPLRESPAAASIVGRDALLSMPRGVGMDEALMLVPGVKVD